MPLNFIDQEQANNDRQTLMPLEFFPHKAILGFEDMVYTREDLAHFILLLSPSSCFTNTIFTVKLGTIHSSGSMYVSSQGFREKMNSMI
ncbi:hypothetical protein Ccrd_000785 [Cynara cardunculus var. scolymus]|uniref:Uncharacterized protein n=1 Tax=Cynara cardunculus var. scolymus TaxID=59895 RepID=A0A103XUH9_CYNCS|nr:hypothetical protein Ccrd_000785 [Cynara cardunculus var. scolymus]